MSRVDREFYDRADAHINLSNSQITNEITRGKVSASFMYALARFNAWVSWCGFEKREDMEKAKEETIDFFVNQYRMMLEENLDDYISNFDSYMEIYDREEE